MWNFIVPAIVGAGISMLQNRNPIQGAIIGGATGGLLGGGFEGFGSALSSGATVPTVTPTLGGLSLSGATTGTVGGLGANIGAGASGLATSTPQTAGGYSSLLGGDTILEPYNIGMNGVKSTLNTTPTAGIDVGGNMVSGNMINQRYTPNLMTTEGARGVPVDTSPGGYVYTPDELEELDNIKTFGSMTGTGDKAVKDNSILDTVKDTTGLEQRDLTLLGINQFAQMGDMKENQPRIQTLPIEKREVAKVGKPLELNVAKNKIRPIFYSA